MNIERTRPCPVCGATDTLVRGPILHPQPPLVAGVPLDLGEVTFSLRRCPQCGFQFKDPEIDPTRLIACYEAADSSNWGESPDPWQRQFDVLRAVLDQHALGRRVLDVGCFNGALLEYVGDGWSRCGIEPSRDAAVLARERGVDVLADTLEELDAAVEPFDAIFAIDVVEHVGDPVAFFRQVSARLKPGGVFILLTGNTDALAWRWQGSLYWYCSLPEHVSFYNRQSLEKLARLSGMECVECRSLCHKRLGPAHWASDMAKSGVYLLGRSMGGFGLPALRRHLVERRGPTIQAAKDHLLGVLRKS